MASTLIGMFDNGPYLEKGMKLLRERRVLRRCTCIRTPSLMRRRSHCSFPIQGNDVYPGRRLSVLIGIVSTELSTGEAYVELSSPEEATDVQDSYNRKMLGGRYIE